MGFYRRIDVRMHGDDKYLALSRPQPNARTLFEWLIHGELSNAIGLFQAGPAGMAEHLGWSQKAFLERFRELLPDHGQGLVEYCPSHRLVWVRNFLKYNPPSNRNVWAGWLKLFDSLPQCAVKQFWAQHAKEIGKSFGSWFDESILDRFTNYDCQSECHISPTPTPTPTPTPIYSGAAAPRQIASNGQAAADVLRWLNEKSGKNYPANRTNLTFIECRLAEGILPEQLKAIVTRKVKQWGTDEKMRLYLRPATLFNATKCSQYVGELPKLPEAIDADPVPGL